MKGTKILREWEGSLVVILSPRCSTSQNRTPKASLAPSTLWKVVHLPDQEDMQWQRKESFRQQSRVHVLVRQSWVLIYKMECCCKGGVGTGDLLPSTPSNLTAQPHSPQIETSQLFPFFVCGECGKFLKVCPFLPWCLNLIKESSEMLVMWMLI